MPQPTTPPRNAAPPNTTPRTSQAPKPPTARPATSDARLFFQKFLRHGTQVASVAPSSKALAASAAASVDPTQPQIVVELGAGTGPITAEILRRMHPDSRLLAIELDADLAQATRQRLAHDRRLTLIAGSAADLERHLDHAGLGRVDVWVNGLPTPSLPPPVVSAILAAYGSRSATPGGGPLSQISVMPWVYQRFYRRLFREVRFDLVVKNVPPGGVYHCLGLKNA